MNSLTWTKTYIFVFCVVLCLAALVFYACGIENAAAGKRLFGSYKEVAAYGDSFGFVNSLFSGLALIGIVVALFVQTIEFRLAAKERVENLEAQKAISLASTIQTLAELNERGASEKFRESSVLPVDVELAIQEYKQVVILELIVDDAIQERAHPAGTFSKRATLELRAKFTPKKATAKRALILASEIVIETQKITDAKEVSRAKFDEALNRWKIQLQRVFSSANSQVPLSTVVVEFELAKQDLPDEPNNTGSYGDVLDRSLLPQRLWEAGQRFSQAVLKGAMHDLQHTIASK